MCDLSGVRSLLQSSWTKGECSARTALGGPEDAAQGAAEEEERRHAEVHPGAHEGREQVDALFVGGCVGVSGSVGWMMRQTRRPWGGTEESASCHRRLLFRKYARTHGPGGSGRRRRE